MTKEIPLSQGKVAFVDDEDYTLVTQHQWRHLNRGSGYAIAKASGKPIYMHRLVTHAPQGMEVDHINGNGLDNQKSNLRVCAQAENLKHQRRARNNTSGYKGVTWDASQGKWFVEIMSDRRRYYIGRFTSVTDAARAYDAAARQYHGEFACLNFPTEV